MKKIIWVFGQSATGKKTLINNLSNGDSRTIDDLKLYNFKFSVCKNTIIDNETVYPVIDDPFVYDDTNMEQDNEYFTKAKAIKRRSCIMTDTLEFINSDNDILLIKGQDNDISPGRGDIVKYFLQKFIDKSDVEIEVYLLTVQDDELWKQRIAKKKWFQNFKDKHGVLEHMISGRLNRRHENSVINAFGDYNIPITIIDSGENKYTIISRLNPQSKDEKVLFEN